MSAADSTDQATRQALAANAHRIIQQGERIPTPLEYALTEVLTAVNAADPVGAYDDYDDCSAEELHITRELGRIRQLITEIRTSNNLPVVTE